VPRLKLLQPEPDPPGLRAAAYYRMSTGHQHVSIEVQRLAVEAYCIAHGVRLVQTYADEARSGLTARGRPALLSLLEDVQRGPEYQLLLVYDVSRWGRFQDIDEGAYYEFLCRRSGVPVIYCAESFVHDVTPMGAIMKTLKRVMAAEFSKDLSVKVFASNCRYIRRGFRVCGQSMFGLRRMLIDADGLPKQILQAGERKSLRSDRVVLAPGPAEEVAVVRRIYRMFLEDRMTKTRIVQQLNAEGVPTHIGTPWSTHLVRGVLSNPNYAGHNVYNRTSRRMQSKNRMVPQTEWVWARDAFPAIIEPAYFDRVQRVAQARAGLMSDDEVVARVRRVLKTYGRLSIKILDADDELPSSTALKMRFGGLQRLYVLAGYLTEEEAANLHAANIRRFNSLKVSGSLRPINLRRIERMPRSEAKTRPRDARGRLLRKDLGGPPA